MLKGHKDAINAPNELVVGDCGDWLARATSVKSEYKAGAIRNTRGTVGIFLDRNKKIWYIKFHFHDFKIYKWTQFGHKRVFSKKS